MITLKLIEYWFMIHVLEVGGVYLWRIRVTVHLFEWGLLGLC